MPPRLDLDTVKRQHPIEAVVAHYGVELQPHGRWLTGRCPFHADGGRPNLVVYPRSQSWYCFRCAIGGDAIRFVQLREGLGFREAVERLASTPQVAPEPPHLGQAHKGCTPGAMGPEEQACLAVAVEVYRQRLLTEPDALRYVAARGLDRATLERHRLGYAAGHDLLDALRPEGLSVAAARHVGLLRRGREFFHGRITVPAFQDGQPVWLIGRALHGAPNAPKYLGLPGPKPLLGWDEARHEREVYVVEGPFDWLTLRQWGLPALALVGTHASADALQALGRFARVYLALDNDEAGHAATDKLLMRLGRRAVPVHLDGVKDVADLAPHPNGRERFLAMARRAELNRPCCSPARPTSTTEDTMRTFQITYLIGRLGREPELRYTPEGHAVANLSVATDRPTKPDAERETDWHRVVCWNQLAEFAGNYLGKGRLVFVAGRLTYRTWEGKDGQKRTTTEIIANELIALDCRPSTVAPDMPTTETAGSGDDIDF